MTTTHIVRTAKEIQMSNPTNKKVVIVGQDVDLVVLMAVLTPSEKYVHSTAEAQLYSSKKLLQWKDTILWSHAFSGCDTVSALFRKGII